MSHALAFASYSTTMPSPIGTLLLTASDRGLMRVHMGSDGSSRTDPADASAPSSPPDEHHWLLTARSQLEEYFARQREVFDVPLDATGTDFQRAVWRAIGEIPHGRTASYAEIARRIGRPSATRAVGAATGRNPIAIIVPCHRIVGSDGSLTGFAGGLSRKISLLELERGGPGMPSASATNAH